jgi:hypothetical protein
MNANELMIGNWVMYSSPIQVTGKQIAECEQHPDRYAPIEITDSWLLQLGFELNKTEDGVLEYFKQYDFENHGMFIQYSSVDKLWFASEGFLNDYKHELLGLLHVHRLQNLYFALKGEILERPLSDLL